MGRPPKARECRSRWTSTNCLWNQDTTDQICTSIKHGRPKYVSAQRLPGRSAYGPLCLKVIDIRLPAHRPDEFGTRPYFRWVRAQSCSIDTPRILKNASGPVGIPPKWGASARVRKESFLKLFFLALFLRL